MKKHSLISPPLDDKNAISTDNGAKDSGGATGTVNSGPLDNDGGEVIAALHAWEKKRKQDNSNNAHQLSAAQKINHCGDEFDSDNDNVIVLPSPTQQRAEQQEEKGVTTSKEKSNTDVAVASASQQAEASDQTKKVGHTLPAVEEAAMFDPSPGANLQHQKTKTGKCCIIM